MKNDNFGLLHHVELYVQNLEKSLTFWNWFLKELDYAEYQKWDKGISFKKGETYIVFVQVEDKYLKNQYHRCQHGLNHLAFHATKDFVDSMMQKLTDKKINILYSDKYPDKNDEYYALYFEDPDRMKVELVAHNPIS